MGSDCFSYFKFEHSFGRNYKVMSNNRDGNGVTNKEFAKENSTFQKACKTAEVDPTSRQASKYRNKTGKAYNK